MVLDTSAILAILFNEPKGAEFAALLEADEARFVSAATLLEAALVIESRRGEAAGRELDLLILRAGISVVPVDTEQIEIARIAWRQYGKGRHPAGLNYGDCFSYALASVSGEPLLTKDEGFAQTDMNLCK